MAFSTFSKTRLYVIGNSVSNIVSHNTVFSSSSLDYETEKTSFQFSELIKAFTSTQNLTVFRDFAAANQYLTKQVTNTGTKELKKGVQRSDMLDELKVDKVAIPIFEVLVPNDVVEKMFSQAKSDETGLKLAANVLTVSPVCAILKNRVVYENSTLQNYHDIYHKEFTSLFDKEKVNEPQDAILRIESEFHGDREIKIHSPEALERIAHRVKPAPVLVSSLNKLAVVYANPGVLAQLFGQRNNKNRMNQLKQYFGDAKLTHTLTPMDCVIKLNKELNDRNINPAGEYAKILSVLIMAINVSYKNNGNTLDWLNEFNDQLSQTALNIGAIKNIIFSYLDPMYLSWKDSQPDVRPDALQPMR